MATVCGASMALMDAGVPIKMPIAGIAMGLIKSGDKFVILSDILGDEDYLGDMDFKVAGSKEGITALQMDIKVTGITFNIMQQSLEQARLGRLHILEQMYKSIHQSNSAISEYAPCIKSFKIDKDKIREVIGPGGKVIREICDTTKAKIDISDDGMVSVSAIGSENLGAAINKINAIIFEPDIGDIFNGTVVKILDSGAFINYVSNKDGFVHISEISDERIESVASVLSEGSTVKVKIVGFDNKGKAKLTIKNADKQRQLIVTREGVDLMIKKATPEIAPFLKALTYLPLRPGALAKLTVSFFQHSESVLRIGTDKNHSERRISLPPVTSAFFKEQVKRLKMILWAYRMTNEEPLLLVMLH
jgi:polyribonucleotide nucleotidyltransferase